MRKELKVGLIGVGSVGQNLLKILQAKKDRLVKDYDLEIRFVLLADSSGAAYSENGFDIETVLAHKKQGLKIFSLESNKKNENVLDLLETTPMDILFEASPVNLRNGEPGLSICKLVLKKGIHLILANKAPLVLEFQNLHQMASEKQVQIKYSATVCGGLPVMNVAKRDLVLSDVSYIRGVFNCTTNFILSEMEKGRSYEESLKEAQERGIAETDPSMDVDGWDTANKLLITCSTILGKCYSLKDIQVEGITKITKQMVSSVKNDGKSYKLVGKAEIQENGEYLLSVKPEVLDKTDFLAQTSGWEMSVEIKTDLFETVSLKLWEREPIATASSMLRDCIHIFESQQNG